MMFIRPVEKRFGVVSGFGRRECAGPMKSAACRFEDHTGTDYLTPVGTPVRAIADGRIAYVIADEEGSLNGNLIGLNFVDVDGAQMQAAHAHLSEMLASKGQRVSRGEVIARTGNTGNSEGPHLHLGIRRNGSRIDPEMWLQSRVDHNDDAVEPGSGFPKAALFAIAALLLG